MQLNGASAIFNQCSEDGVMSGPRMEVLTPFDQVPVALGQVRFMSVSRKDQCRIAIEVCGTETVEG
jgi:hypothetical protein